MKDFIRRPEFVRSVEFWAATSIFIVAVFFHISYAVTGNTSGVPMLDVTRVGEMPATYYRLFFFPKLIQYTLLYAAFMLMHFVIVPKLVAGRAVAMNILFALLLIALLGLGLGVLETYLQSHILGRFATRDEAYFWIFRDRMLYAVWLTLVYGFYALARHGAVYVLGRYEEFRARYPFLTLGGILAIIMWITGMFFLVSLSDEQIAIAIWAVFPPSAVALYWYTTYRLIPRSLKRRKPFRFYMLRMFLIMASAAIPTGIIATIISTDSEAGFPAGVLNSVFHFLVTAPVSWVLFMRNMKGTEELRYLRERLGQSKANIDFLRSQINPHFLFNALNTIYGTAIQEKADRTGEGVQRLGDMMRFMLQENMQEEIALSREIDYLHNYISLQRLRTDAHSNISISADIEDEVNTARIAPMLLIPFVENAFKHGISLREPSYIKIGLELKDTVLNLDVHNSRHIRPEGDPEKNKSGIGLNNVRQRLELLYPKRHELIIRETGKEFFVHLTVQLS
jgi:two-component system LytT family sensor kinase